MFKPHSSFDHCPHGADDTLFVSRYPKLPDTSIAHRTSVYCSNLGSLRCRKTQGGRIILSVTVRNPVVEHCIHGATRDLQGHAGVDLTGEPQGTNGGVFQIQGIRIGLGVGHHSIQGTQVYVVQLDGVDVVAGDIKSANGLVIRHVSDNGRRWI